MVGEAGSPFEDSLCGVVRDNRCRLVFWGGISRRYVVAVHSWTEANQCSTNFSRADHTYCDAYAYASASHRPCYHLKAYPHGDCGTIAYRNTDCDTNACAFAHVITFSDLVVCANRCGDDCYPTYAHSVTSAVGLGPFNACAYGSAGL